MGSCESSGNVAAHNDDDGNQDGSVNDNNCGDKNFVEVLERIASMEERHGAKDAGHPAREPPPPYSFVNARCKLAAQRVERGESSIGNDGNDCNDGTPRSSLNLWGSEGNYEVPKTKTSPPCLVLVDRWLSTVVVATDGDKTRDIDVNSSQLPPTETVDDSEGSIQH